MYQCVMYNFTQLIASTVSIKVYFLKSFFLFIYFFWGGGGYFYCSCHLLFCFLSFVFISFFCFHVHVALVLCLKFLSLHIWYFFFTWGIALILNTIFNFVTNKNMKTSITAYTISINNLREKLISNYQKHQNTYKFK